MTTRMARQIGTNISIGSSEKISISPILCALSILESFLDFIDPFRNSSFHNFQFNARVVKFLRFYNPSEKIVKIQRGPLNIQEISLIFNYNVQLLILNIAESI